MLQINKFLPQLEGPPRLPLLNIVHLFLDISFCIDILLIYLVEFVMDQSIELFQYDDHRLLDTLVYFGMDEAVEVFQVFFGVAPVRRILN